VLLDGLCSKQKKPALASFFFFADQQVNECWLYPAVFQYLRSGYFVKIGKICL
jgi:hypothetical protein